MVGVNKIDGSRVGIVGSRGRGGGQGVGVVGLRGQEGWG